VVGLRLLLFVGENRSDNLSADFENRFWDDSRLMMLSEPRRFRIRPWTPGLLKFCDRAMFAQLLVAVSGVAASACGTSEKMALAIVNISAAYGAGADSIKE
jgi:hypothetical protein